MFDLERKRDRAEPASHSVLGLQEPEDEGGEPPITRSFLGLAGAAAFAGHLPVLVYLAVAVAIAVGALLTAGAAVLPARMLRRLPTAQLLAEE